MAIVFIDMLLEHFELSNNEKVLLQKTVRQLNRSERRYYFSNIKPREKIFKNFFKNRYKELDPQSQQEWIVIIAQSMLNRGGEPDITDSLLMSVVGRISVYSHMRTKAEKEGIKLNALVSFGGMSTVIILVGIITALVLYFISK